MAAPNFFAEAALHLKWRQYREDGGWPGFEFKKK
jgi:hypothetical protein